MPSRYCSTAPARALALIGAAFLAVTGGEALYADMGHFGKQPVRVAWFSLVWPALLLNYMGQGALRLHGGGADHAMYALVPQTLLPLMVVLATAASVIASQAVISGAFSVARQAIQLDLLPRMRVLQTSAHEQGQIYVPVVNVLLLVFVSMFVLAFGSSDALAGAYGAAVVGTMFITTILGAFVAVTQWGWPPLAVGGLFSGLLCLDAVFVAGNMTKIPAGGWVPLTLAVWLYAVFSTWRSGRVDLRRGAGGPGAAAADLVQAAGGCLPGAGHRRVPRQPSGVHPLGADPQFQHNKIVHERILILNFQIMDTPRQSQTDRARVQELASGRVRHHGALRLHGNPRRSRGAARLSFAGTARVPGGLLVLHRPARRRGAAAAGLAGPEAARCLRGCSVAAGRPPSFSACRCVTPSS